jgi:glycosyltransferase involved in cell wall biosynthesis
MDRIRVLHIVPTLSPGGAERVAVHISRGLNRHRYEAVVVALGQRVESSLGRLLEQDGIEVRYLGKPPGFDCRMYFRMHRLFKECRPTIINTHMQVLRYALPLMLSLKGAVLLHTVHNLAEREIEPGAHWIHRYAFQHGVLPVAVAEEVARSVRSLYGIQRCPMISNGIPTDYYARPRIPRAEWRAKEGFRDEDVLFVCVARFAPQKNHALLLEAFADGPASDPSAHLVLVGEGELQERLENQAKNLGLAHRIHFLGLRTDIPDTLGAADVFVLSSDFEGNPLSVMEAMSSGLPIVSTAVGGVPDLFESGKQGLTVKPGDVQGLSNSMGYFLANRGARLSLGRAAALRAREKFDVETMVRAYEGLYEELIGRSDLLDRKNILQEPLIPVQHQ